MSEIRCYPLDRMLYQEQPEAAKYAMLHGKTGLMSRNWNDADLGPYNSTEDVYKACLEKGVTWQELLNYKLDSDKIY